MKHVLTDNSINVVSNVFSADKIIKCNNRLIHTQIAESVALLVFISLSKAIFIHFVAVTCKQHNNIYFGQTVLKAVESDSRSLFV